MASQNRSTRSRGRLRLGLFGLGIGRECRLGLEPGPQPTHQRDQSPRRKPCEQDGHERNYCSRRPMRLDCLALRSKSSFGAFFRRISWWDTVGPVVTYSRCGYHHILRVVDYDAVAPKAPGRSTQRKQLDLSEPNH